MAIKQDTLKQYSERYYMATNEALRKSASSGRKKTGFLCHSHRDEVLVKGVIVMFQEAGVDLYIDWQDQSMPDTPNKETAQKLVKKIKDCDLFLFLATENSKASRWCPWEIGHADSSNKNIYIIPTTDGNTTHGNEYLELYKRIDISGRDPYFGRDVLGFFEPGARIASPLINLTR